MIYLLFLASLICYFALKSAQKQKNSSERKIAVIKSISHFVLVFCIVAFIVSLLQLWLDKATDIEIAKATILNIEQTQFKIKDFVSHFKIGFEYDMLILLLLIGLASTFPLLEQYGIHDKLKKFNKVVKSILFFLTISTCFTFFGNRLAFTEEGRIGKLEFHKLQIIEKNKLLLKSIQNEVTNRVVNEIISNSEIQSELDKIEAAKSTISATTNAEDYKRYIAAIPSNLISNLSFTGFEKDFTRYDIATSFETVEEKFRTASYNASPEGNFYSLQEENLTSKVKEKSRAWFSEKEFSETSVKQAEELFTKSSNANPTKYAKYYTKYKEPIEKLIKKGYSNSGSKLINAFFEMIGVDFPFLSEFIDPIINEPIQDFIIKKTEAIFKVSLENQGVSVEEEIKKCSSEFQNAFDVQVKNNQKFAKFQVETSEQLVNLNNVVELTKGELQNEIQKADTYLADLSSKSRWEDIRKRFSYRLENLNDLEGFSNGQLQNFKKVLLQWENYKAEQKLNWYLNSTNDIEEQFFSFSKNDGNVRGCWGFILQQEDWDGASIFYSEHPTAKASGKPYFLLKYYYTSIGKEEQVESLYDGSVNRAIDKMCPH